MPTRALVLTARWALADSERTAAGGGILVSAGRVQRWLGSRGAVRRAARDARLVDAGDALLAPGSIDAHAHLGLGSLHGELPRARGLAAWIGALLAARARGHPRDVEAHARAGAAALLAAGTTAVGDVDATGAVAGALAAAGIRARVYGEVLDAWDDARTPVAIARARARAPRARRVAPGLSPHAPYTASAALLEAVARTAARRRLALAIHWAESDEEAPWLERGAGPFAALPLRSPGRSAMELLRAAGLLGARTALIHGNHPARGDVRTVAESGASVVHCPGCHAFFGRERFPLREYLRAGVNVALGTDSLASNDALDMRREMALLRAREPWLDPRAVWRMASECGARAIGFDGRLGRLAPGSWADAVAYRCAADSAGALFDELTAARPSVAGVWISGRRARAAESEPGARARAASDIH